MADLPVRPWHTLLARSLPRSALATPFVSCTVGGNEGKDICQLVMGRAASPMLYSRTQTAGATRSQFPFSTILTVEGLLAASRVRRTALG